MLILEDTDSSSVEVAAIFGEDSNNACAMVDVDDLQTVEIRAAGDMY